jgi:hypothetical protein
VTPEELYYREGIGTCEPCLIASQAEHTLARNCLTSPQLSRDRYSLRGLTIYSPRGPQILSAVGLWAFRGGMHRRYKSEIAAANAAANAANTTPRTPPPDDAGIGGHKPQ